LLILKGEKQKGGDMFTTISNRRSFLKLMGLGTAALAFPGCSGIFHAQNTSSRPPNIVLILTDDQGYADVGCFGAEGFETANLDGMAAEGMRFTDFHVSQAVCSASRAALMTGCYNTRVSIQGALGPQGKVGLNPDEETIAEVLKKRGYTSGIFGKWHLGHRKEFLPLQQGFDEYYGLPYSNDMWPHGYDGKPLARKTNYPILRLIDGNEPAEEIQTFEDQATLTTRYTERAVRFIEKNKEKPFFLYVPHSMPHVPLGVSSKFKGKSKQGMYGDVIMEIDWSVGEILKALKEHGLDERTLVVFTSDNGPWLNFGNHAGSAKPLREGKGTMWEGGDRVPCIMRWPGQIPAGTECRRIAATIDLLPTFAAISGAPLPTRKIDGVNILPLLKGEKGANPRDHFFYWWGRELQFVRQGKWKLVFPHTYTSYEGVEPGKDGMPGPTARGKTGLELYDLENDAEERMNVLDQYPEVVKRLTTLAETAREELGDSLTKREGKEVRPSGKAAE
jgi:arylsulfatase